MGDHIVAISQARPLELDLLCQKLEADYSTRIQGEGTKPEAKKSNFLSKAIAAFVLHEEAKATLDEAVAASIDGGFDHGIDSVYLAPDQTIWLVQSKYKDSGSGEPELGEVSKFRDGVTDLLHGKFDRFNQNLQKRQAQIVGALDNESCRVRVVLVYSGTAMADDKRNIFNDLENAFNGTNPGFVRCFSYGLSTLHDLHMTGLSAAPIDATLEIRDFGHTQSPYRSFYGRIDAKFLAELWSEHKDRLVERNIRRFKGSTTVNAGLRKTLQEESDHFFYFNNGVTFLCQSIQEQFPRDSHRRSGKFLAKGISIINGAQTVGAIAREPVAHYEEHATEVMVTLICLDSAPDDFGDRVTQYRNRQNSVELEDFAALDERQIMWQQTLRASDIDYLVQEGADDPAPSGRCFSAREAAPFLACTITGKEWPDFVIAAKTDKKRLFGREGLVSSKDPLQDAYARLFPDSLTARQMWRTVQIGRYVQEKIRDESRSISDPTTLPEGALPGKEILKHAGWLVLHVICIRLQSQNGASLLLGQTDLEALSREVNLVTTKLVSVVQAISWGKQARSIFENKTDCQTVKKQLMAALARQN